MDASPQMQDEYAHAVARHVDDVGDDGNVHGHVGFPDTAAQCRPRIVDGQERQGQRGDPEIGLTRRHHVRFDAAEQQPQKLSAEHQYQRRHHHGDDRRDHQQLSRRTGRRLVIFAADVLADDDCAAGGQRREQEDQHGVEGRDQRHAGHVRLAGKADHERVGDAHEHQQKLLDKQRNDQIPQVFVGEHFTPRISL